MSVDYKVPDINTFDIIDSRNRSRPKVAIPGADHKECGLLGRDSNGQITIWEIIITLTLQSFPKFEESVSRANPKIYSYWITIP